MREKFEQIEAYLAGELEGEARAEFERAVQNDPELAAELALYRDMAVALAPAAEDALRANLDRLDRQFAPASRRNRLWWIVGFSLLLIVAAWLIWRPKPAEPQVPGPGAPKVAPPVAQQPAPSAPAAPNPDTPKQGPDAPARQTEPRRVAVAFEPNPRLESLLGNQLRGDDYHFQVAQPAAGATLKRRGGQAGFLLSGVVKTSAAQVSTPFRVLIFSNNPRDYEDFRFVLAAPLVFEKSGGAFRFELSRPLQAPSGLYYYLIEAGDSGLLYYVGKFRVKD